MNTLELYDRMNIISAKIDDMRFLHREIIENFFEGYNTDNPQSIYDIANDFNRYAALARILDNGIFNAGESLKEIIKAVKNND